MVQEGRKAMEIYLRDVSNIMPTKYLDDQMIEECTKSMA